MGLSLRTEPWFLNIRHCSANSLSFVVIIPPSPEVIILVANKEKHPAKPKFPALILLIEAPTACDASSKIIKLSI